VLICHSLHNVNSQSLFQEHIVFVLVLSCLERDLSPVKQTVGIPTHCVKRRYLCTPKCAGEDNKTAASSPSRCLTCLRAGQKQSHHPVQSLNTPPLPLSLSTHLPPHTITQVISLSLTPKRPKSHIKLITNTVVPAAIHPSQSFISTRSHFPVPIAQTPHCKPYIKLINKIPSSAKTHRIEHKERK